MISRRELLAGIPLSAFSQRNSRPKIAAVVTTYFKFSHAQHIVDRFLEGYGWNGEHHRPPMDLVSLYVNQVGSNDLSRDRAARFPSMKLYPSIAEALTLGGSKLAVDGVLLVGEHGRYPRTEKGQHQYPRYEFFQQIVKVFESSGTNEIVKNCPWNPRIIWVPFRLRLPRRGRNFSRNFSVPPALKARRTFSRSKLQTRKIIGTFKAFEPSPMESWSGPGHRIQAGYRPKSPSSI